MSRGSDYAMISQSINSPYHYKTHVSFYCTVSVAAYGSNKERRDTKQLIITIEPTVDKESGAVRFETFRHLGRGL